MTLQSISTLIFVAGLVILINAISWPFKVIGCACLILGFILDKRVFEYVRKASKVHSSKK